jgi:hypothetical protein
LDSDYVSRTPYLCGDGLAFSADGKTLVAGRADAVILWDVASRRTVGRPLN